MRQTLTAGVQHRKGGGSLNDGDPDREHQQADDAPGEQRAAKVAAQPVPAARLVATGHAQPPQIRRTSPVPDITYPSNPFPAPEISLRTAKARGHQVTASLVPARR